MRIAQIAPLCESVPPKLYGGTERIVSFLTDELVRQGHEVTLFASGDSKTSAKLVPCCDLALRLNPSVKDTLPYHIIMLEEVRKRADQFDLLHFHIDFLHAPMDPPTGGSHADDPARAPGLAGPRAVLQRFSRAPAGLHLQQSAPPPSRCQLGWKRPSRSSPRSAAV